MKAMRCQEKACLSFMYPTKKIEVDVYMDAEIQEPSDLVCKLQLQIIDAFL